jgi:hypothetical protein
MNELQKRLLKARQEREAELGRPLSREEEDELKQKLTEAFFSELTSS